MAEHKKNAKAAEENEQEQLSANVCAWASDYTCLSCHWFDGRYHDGYCDYYKTDTNPDGYCSHYKW